MTSSRLAAALTATVLCVAPLGAQVFRAGTDVVYLSVTVVDREGQLVGGLDQNAFQVLEDGLPQQVEIFSAEPQPIALSILLDTSTSMEARLATAQEAAAGFARRLTPVDVAQIIQFDNQVEILQEFTSDSALLEAAIRRTAAGGSTSLYTAVYVAMSEQRKVRSRSVDDVRRQALVVLSDGGDTSSLVDDEQVIDLSKRSEVAVYAIVLRTPGEAASGFSESEYVLRTLCQESGGRVFSVDTAEALPDIYEQIALELANQYTIGYTSTNTTRDGAWRTIRVGVDVPGATARARSGYYGPRARIRQ